MTVFCQRVNGKIVGVFARRQPGIADEELSANDPEVLTYLNPTPDDAPTRVAKRLVSDPVVKVLGEYIKMKEGWTTVQLLAWVRSIL